MGTTTNYSDQTDSTRPLTPDQCLRILAQHGMDIIDPSDPSGDEDFVTMWERAGRSLTLGSMLCWLGY